MVVVVVVMGVWLATYKGHVCWDVASSKAGRKRVSVREGRRRSELD